MPDAAQGRLDEGPGGRSDLDLVVAWSLLRAARRAVHALAEALQPLQLTTVQFGALAQLRVEPDLTGTELARRIELRPQSTNAVIDALLERGLIARAHAGGSGRRNPLRLTPAGTGLLDAAWPRALAVSGPIALPLNTSETASLIELLRQILED